MFDSSFLFQEFKRHLKDTTYEHFISLYIPGVLPSQSSYSIDVHFQENPHLTRDS